MMMSIGIIECLMESRDVGSVRDQISVASERLATFLQPYDVWHGHFCLNLTLLVGTPRGTVRSAIAWRTNII